MDNDLPSFGKIGDEESITGIDYTCLDGTGGTSTGSPPPTSALQAAATASRSRSLSSVANPNYLNATSKMTEDNNNNNDAIFELTMGYYNKDYSDTTTTSSNQVVRDPQHQLIQQQQRLQQQQQIAQQQQQRLQQQQKQLLNQEQYYRQEQLQQQQLQLQQLQRLQQQLRQQQQQQDCQDQQYEQLEEQQQEYQQQPQPQHHYLQLRQQQEQIHQLQQHRQQQLQQHLQQRQYLQQQSEQQQSQEQLRQRLEQQLQHLQNLQKKEQQENRPFLHSNDEEFPAADSIVSSSSLHEQQQSSQQQLSLILPNQQRTSSISLRERTGERRESIQVNTSDGDRFQRLFDQPQLLNRLRDQILLDDDSSHSSKHTRNLSEEVLPDSVILQYLEEQRELDGTTQKQTHSKEQGRFQQDDQLTKKQHGDPMLVRSKDDLDPSSLHDSQDSLQHSTEVDDELTENVDDVIKSTSPLSPKLQRLKRKRGSSKTQNEDGTGTTTTTETVYQRKHPPYRDFAAVFDSNELSKTLNHEPLFIRDTFPVILHNVLTMTSISSDKVTSSGLKLSQIIFWHHHGRTFQISDKKLFSDEILPNYFPTQNQYSSFHRQLNNYGFLRLTGTTKDSTVFYHELFLRGRPDLAAYIPRLRHIQSSVRQSLDPSSEPNFTAYPPLPDVVVQPSTVSSSTTSNTATTTSSSGANAAIVGGKFAHPPLPNIPPNLLLFNNNPALDTYSPASSSSSSFLLATTPNFHQSHQCYQYPGITTGRFIRQSFLTNFLSKGQQYLDHGPKKFVPSSGMNEEFELLYKLQSQGSLTAKKARDAITALTTKQEESYIRTKAESDSDSSTSIKKVLTPGSGRKGMVHPVTTTSTTIIEDLSRLGTGKSDSNIRQQHLAVANINNNSNTNSSTTSLKQGGERDEM